MGNMRVRTRLTELVRGGETEPAPTEAPKRRRKKTVDSGQLPVVSQPAPGIELDLRGQRVEDALEKLGDYLDRGYLAQAPFVRIIHGKGTGKLRDAVREALKGHAYVRSFEAGIHGEGGDGVTVVKFNE
jgi:DNA mismatch repair protein MutS2